jgi:hypothetical protein
MNRITLLRIIESTAQMLEFVGVVVIGISFIYASFRGLSDYRQKKTDTYDRIKSLLEWACSWGWNFWSPRTSSVP